MEADVAVDQLQEISIFRETQYQIKYEEKTSLSDQALRAMAIAQAVAKTSLTEKELATARHEEAELYLQATHHERDVIEHKLVLAERQLYVLVNKIQSQGLLSTFPNPQDYDDDDEGDHGYEHNDFILPGGNEIIGTGIWQPQHPWSLWHNKELELNVN